jgi:hypothetical protein
MRSDLQTIDHATLRTNQALIIALLLAAFIANVEGLVPVVAIIMGAGTLIGKPGFVLVYRWLRQASLIKPDRLQDNPEPHRFAQGLGSAVLFGATACHSFQLSSLGWALAWVVIILAALNLFGGFCVGCALYYWLSRAGLPGFSKAPPPDTIPGRRPATDH